MSEECYARVSINDFGLAMLQKMGWSEQRGIGKSTQNQLKVPIEFIPRNYRLGLGAESKPFLRDKKGKPLGPQKYAQNGKSYAALGEKLVQKKKIFDINTEV